VSDEKFYARDHNYNPSAYLRRSFIAYLTSFFMSNPQLKYRIYDENAEPDENFKSLLITSSYNLTTPDKNKLPMIVVERGPIVSSIVTKAARYVGDGRGDGSKLFTSALSTSIIMHCLDESDEEADKLANLVRVAIEFDYTLFNSYFEITMEAVQIDHVQLMKETPMTYRSSVMAPVMLQVTFDVTHISGETLREVELLLNNEQKTLILQ